MLSQVLSKRGLQDIQYICVKLLEVLHCLHYSYERFACNEKSSVPHEFWNAACCLSSLETNLNDKTLEVKSCSSISEDAQSQLWEWSR